MDFGNDKPVFGKLKGFNMKSRLLFTLRCAFWCALIISASVVSAQAIVPGTGTLLTEVGDDFEDAEWSYNPNLPKVTNFEDTTHGKNFPLGASANGRWHEGSKRGQPDSVRRVETPPGGLPGSTGAIALRSLHTGSTYPTNQQQQDDFICNLADKIGTIPVGRTPNVVTRVWMPPLDQWEKRNGCHFAFRIALVRPSTMSYSGRGRFRQASSSAEDDLYWPGFFLNREAGTDAKTGEKVDRVYFWMKATADSRAIKGPDVEQFGWWTLGISVTPDGQVHYFAKPGVEDLTAKDHVASAFPFGNRAITFRTFFFNTCNGDDGKTWSTEFIVDDSKVYLGK
jgi:hypothetical protein